MGMFSRLTRIALEHPGCPGETLSGAVILCLKGGLCRASGCDPSARVSSQAPGEGGVVPAHRPLQGGAGQVVPQAHPLRPGVLRYKLK